MYLKLSSIQLNNAGNRSSSIEQLKDEHLDLDCFEKLDVEFIKEEYRLREYRKSAIDLTLFNSSNWNNKTTSVGDIQSLCDSVASTSISINEFESLSQWHNISIHNMLSQRHEIIEEEKLATLRMKKEKEDFYRALHEKHMNAMIAKIEAHKKNKERKAMVSEQLQPKSNLIVRKVEEKYAEVADTLLDEQNEKNRIVAERKKRSEMIATKKATELEKKNEMQNVIDMRGEDARCQQVEFAINAKLRYSYRYNIILCDNI